MIYNTEEILRDLNNHIKRSTPFSTIRLGDAFLGVVASFRDPHLVRHKLWKHPVGLEKSNLIFRRLGVPPREIEKYIDVVIKYTNESNYTDSYESWKSKGLQLNKNSPESLQKEIHEMMGMSNQFNCNPFVHYFSIVDGEYNLFDIMKDRKIFCISNNLEITPNLKEKSGAKVIDQFKIPRRSDEEIKKHFEFFPEIINLIEHEAENYDLFLIGAGFFGKIYCGKVKECSGRAFDSGRLFDVWAGERDLVWHIEDNIQFDSELMLCKRIKTSTDPVW